MPFQSISPSFGQIKAGLYTNAPYPFHRVIREKYVKTLEENSLKTKTFKMDDDDPSIKTIVLGYEEPQDIAELNNLEDARKWLVDKHTEGDTLTDNNLPNIFKMAEGERLKSNPFEKIEIAEADRDEIKERLEPLGLLDTYNSWVGGDVVQTFLSFLKN